jgi:anti-sigma B factor antagonist
MESTEFFKEFNERNKEVEILEDYFNNSEEFIILKSIGLLDTYNSSQYYKTITQFLSLKPRKVCVMEITNISYMSSTGIGVFVELLKFCSDKKIVFYIMGIQTNVDEIFNLLGFKSFFNYIT